MADFRGVVEYHDPKNIQLFFQMHPHEQVIAFTVLDLANVSADTIYFRLVGEPPFLGVLDVVFVINTTTKEAAVAQAELRKRIKLNVGKVRIIVRPRAS